MLPIFTIGPENIVYIVVGDLITHDNEHPFCGGDPECPCRSDSNLVREFIDKPLDNGLLTNSEAIRLYFGRQLVPTQDELTDEPSLISVRFQGMMDSLLIDHD